MELESQSEAFRRRGLGVAAMSYDPVPVLKDFATRRKITFPLLSDPDSAVIRLFGLLNPEYPEGHMAHGVPYPGTLVADAKGVIREKYFEEAYSERRTAASMLFLEGGAGFPIAETRTDHFTLRLSASSESLAPGQHASLALDFEMRPGRHAYAPGAKDYRPLALHLQPSPLVKPGETRFPAPVQYEFKALGETVPVFTGQFRLLQDVALTTGKDVAELLKSPDPKLDVEGVLDYQVCSDTTCYAPASLPVRWSFKVVPLDRERPPEGLRKPPPTR